METPKIPSSWDDVSVSQFIELYSIDETQFESEFYLQLEKLAILTNTTSEDECWEYFDVFGIIEIMKSMTFLSYPPSQKFRKALENDFKYKDINDITLGEFLDFEYYVNNGVFDNFGKILSIAYRKTKIGEWGEIIYEPYSVINIEKRKFEFDEIPISHVYGIIDEYKKFKDTFMENYKPLFEIPYEDIDDDKLLEYVGADAETIEEINEAKEEYSTQKKWGWEQLLYKLADGDLLKIEKLTYLGLIYLFNFLSMQKETGLLNK
jgi:hypothetical protein